MALPKRDHNDKNEAPKSTGKYPPIIDPTIIPNITIDLEDII
jgi:hypothetical protein